MPHELALIIPAAGRGSRFAKLGFAEPKPLLELHGRPFFWWAVESVRRVVATRQLIFVVLQEHIDDFAIARKIHSYYPAAQVIALPDVTGGAAETAAVGMRALARPGPVAINDCDHAFICPSLAGIVKALQRDTEAALMCFRSASPAYSNARLDLNGKVIGTAEKEVISPFAIAGCYLFSDAGRFGELYESYKQSCAYNELFLSGVFNLAAERQLPIGMVEVERHCSFGTPEEMATVTAEVFAPYAAWK